MSRLASTSDLTPCFSPPLQALMAKEIECLRAERDRYKRKVEMQAKELQDIRRRTFFCERCGKGTTSAPRIINSSPKASPLPGSQSQSLENASTLRYVTPSHPTQFTMTRIPRGNPASPASDTVRTHQSLSRPSACRVPIFSSLSNGHPFDKELHVEEAHVLLHEEMIRCVNFRQDGRYLAVGCDDGNVYIYDVQTGSLNRKLLGERDRIAAVSFSRDGNHLATGSIDGNIYIWEIKTKFVRKAFKGHTDSIRSLDFSPNGQMLVSASSDNNVRLWSMRYGATKFLSDRPNSVDDNGWYHYPSAVFSPDGKYIAAVHEDGIVRIWKERTGQLMRRLVLYSNWVKGVAFMPDGKGLVTGHFDNTLKYWGLVSLDSRFDDSRSEFITTTCTWPDRDFLGQTNSVDSVAISPDGKWVASVLLDQRVRIWDTRNGAMECILSGDNHWVYSVEFSPAGYYLASGGSGGMVKIWRYSYTPLGGSI